MKVYADIPSLKKLLEYGWEILKWRVEAWRMGESFADVAMRRRRIYQVEQLVLVHRKTNRWLLHVAGDSEMAEDSAEVTAMLGEIQEIALDYFSVATKPGVKEFRVDDAKVWIAPGPMAHLAAVICGQPQPELRLVLEQALDRIHIEHEAELAHFEGDASVFEAAGAELIGCLRTEDKPAPELPQLKNARGWFGAAAAVILIAGGLELQSRQRWNDFLARLRSEPGILIAEAERHWFAPSRVIGLRDPQARDPAAIAREAKVNHAGVRFEWKDYVANDPVLAKRRSWRVPSFVPGVSSPVRREGTSGPVDGRVLEEFKAVFPLPPGVKATVANRTLILAGNVPYEWIARVQDGASRITGIDAINGDDLVVEVDSDLVLERFRELFSIPQGVETTLRDGQLILTGEAPHAWLDRVRREALRVPGVHLVDDRRVVDIDQRTFHEAKSALEDTALLFILNRDSIPPDAAAGLTQVAEQLRRCFAAARNLGVNVILELDGYGDAIGTEAENAELSRRRAEAVRNFLTETGIEGQKISSLGKGTPPPPAAGEKPGAGKFDRRVFFRIVIQP